MNVLIAHPEQAARRLLRVMLEEMGHQVMAAVEDPDPLFHFGLHAPPDLILCAVAFDGADVAEVLRQLFEVRYLPVIVIVRQHDIDRAEALVTDGAMGYLVEPCTRDDLRPMLTSVLRRFRELAQLREENQRLKLRLRGSAPASRRPI